MLVGSAAGLGLDVTRQRVRVPGASIEHGGVEHTADMHRCDDETRALAADTTNSLDFREGLLEDLSAIEHIAVVPAV